MHLAARRAAALPFVYADEVWTGIEYQVAAHLIYEGCVEEGLEIVEAVRDRHDGVRRNPWDEVECGHHYARSMASWALLLALSGFHYDAADRRDCLRSRDTGRDFAASSARAQAGAPSISSAQAILFQRTSSSTGASCPWEK